MKSSLPSRLQGRLCRGPSGCDGYFGFDELQADAIVKLQLGRLAGLEILKIEQELGELRTAIADYEDILANDEHVKRIVKTDLTTLADKYGDERRTSIETVSGEVDIEDLIPEETCVFTLTTRAHIKRTTLGHLPGTDRGGRACRHDPEGRRLHRGTFCRFYA